MLLLLLSFGQYIKQPFRWVVVLPELRSFRDELMIIRRSEARSRRFPLPLFSQAQYGAYPSHCGARRTQSVPTVTGRLEERWFTTEGPGKLQWTLRGLPAQLGTSKGLLIEGGLSQQHFHWVKIYIYNNKSPKYKNSNQMFTGMLC